MDQELRKRLIDKHLDIKPINHGLVYSFQIALPDSKKKPIGLEKRRAIENSLLTQGSNLSSLIIRRTEAYDDEDIEYELVYGADWLQVAHELDIEKVWAWVFDLTDEEAIATAEEMERLTSSVETSVTNTSSESDNLNASALIDQKLQLSTDSIKAVMTRALKEIKDELDERLKLINYRIDQLSETRSSADLEAILKKLDQIEQQSRRGGRSSRPDKKLDEPINLLEASRQEVEAALSNIGTSRQYIQAALKAIDKWKDSQQGLTWKNLGRSKRSGSPDKVSDFGDATYNALWTIASIPGDPEDTK